VFINDITDIISHCKIRLFADDTALYIEVDDRTQAAEYINSDLKSIEEWSKFWLVSFSAPKTESMIIGYKPNQMEHPDLFLHNTTISQVSRHKHVGVWLESNLWWHHHIQEIVTKTQNKLNVLSFYKYKIQRSKLEALYLSFIRPLMEYASVVWAGAHNIDLEALDRVQVRAMHLVTGCTRGTSHSLLYSECGWKSLRERRDIATLKLLYRCVRQDAPSYLHNILPKQNNEVSVYNLRNPTNYIVPRSRVLCHYNSFLLRAIRQWNSLNETIHLMPTIAMFKQAIAPTSSLDETDYKWLKFISDIGKRKGSVTLTRLRCGCSALNYDLAINLKVKKCKICACGFPSETAYHYFYDCKLFLDHRKVLFTTLHQLMPNINPTLDMLLSGSKAHSRAMNNELILQVHNYIYVTGRFV
jgi:hypothetical protein